MGDAAGVAIATPNTSQAIATGLVCLAVNDPGGCKYRRKGRYGRSTAVGRLARAVLSASAILLNIAAFAVLSGEAFIPLHFAAGDALQFD